MTQPLRSTSATTDTGGPTVLIVEDYESVRRALSNLFQSVGLEVQLFGSASDMLKSQLPVTASCLVLDVRLPGLSGLSTSKSGLTPVSPHNAAPGPLRTCRGD
jgi:FixJ family two-component response regulator